MIEIEYGELATQMRNIEDLLKSPISSSNRLDSKSILKWIDNSLINIDYDRLDCIYQHSTVNDYLISNMGYLENLLEGRYGITLDYGDISLGEAYSTLLDTVNLITFKGTYLIENVLRLLIKDNIRSGLNLIEFDTYDMVALKLFQHYDEYIDTVYDRLVLIKPFDSLSLNYIAKVDVKFLSRIMDDQLYEGDSVLHPSFINKIIKKIVEEINIEELQLQDTRKRIKFR